MEVAETGSTNADLLDMADRELTAAPHRTALRADHQTAGRGRLDRRWEAPPGSNLLVSLLFREVPDPPNELARRVALAAIDAAARLAGVDAALKWPNDVVVGDAKLAGILSQRAVSGPVVVGIGMNLAWAPDGAAKLGEIDPAVALRTLLDAYDALPASIDERYRASLSTLGRRVRVELPTGDVVGRAVDVDADGRIVVLDECAVTHRFDAADVVHLRPDQPQ
jgi:BirA family biotin operon repressor/biotin-[acetyl-CoA-carboxylase] ligase